MVRYGASTSGRAGPRFGWPRSGRQAFLPILYVISICLAAFSLVMGISR